MATEEKTTPQRVLAIWEQYCNAMKTAGLNLLSENMPADELTQAEGLRYLSRLARASSEWFVEYDDPDFPVLYRPAHEGLKMGGDNPDSHYQKCSLSGRNTYKISGKRNSIHYISFTTSKGSYATTGSQITTGFIDNDDLVIDADGRFEIIVSSEQPEARNWLQMEPESESLLIRQNYIDRSQEVPADLRIERIDTNTGPAPLELAATERAFARAGGFFTNIIPMFGRWPDLFRQHLNQLPYQDQQLFQSVGGDPQIIYYISYWELQDDEALVVELERVPNCKYWNFQLTNQWMESLDYVHYKVHTNGGLATPEHDGSVRMIVSAQDPGHPNWLNTVQHRHGGMIFRWVDCPEPVHPTTRVIKLKNL